MVFRIYLLDVPYVYIRAYTVQFSCKLDWEYLISQLECKENKNVIRATIVFIVVIFYNNRSINNNRS